MSHENVETVRRFSAAAERALASHAKNPRSLADAVRAGELAAEDEELWSYLHPDVEWNAGSLGTYRGRLQIAQAWDEIYEVAEHYSTSTRSLIDCGGDRVFAAVDRTITARGSGIHTTIPVFVVLTLRDGLITRGDEYLDRSQAFAAAGLPSQVAAADEITNAATGERYVFRGGEGDVLELDGFLAPGGGVPGEHLHPEQEERFELISGESGFMIDGGEVAASAGDLVVVPPGTRHVWWNRGATEVEARITFRPALRTEEFLRVLFSMVAAGRADSRGRPGLLGGAALMHEFRREVRLARPPWLIQRALLPPAAWLGRRLG